MKKCFLLVITVFLTVMTYAQKQLKEGRVINAQTGAPVPHATIQAASGKSISTDEQGVFNIAVEKDEVLTISSIGYETLKIKAGDNSSFTLTPAVTTLEVVEVGTRRNGR